MIVHDVPQGSPEWMKLRLGIPTASSFAKLLTPKTLKPSASMGAYTHGLLAEYFLGEPVDADANQWMDRGKELEAEARNWYAFEKDCDVREVGFVTTDDGLVGCSPDGLVGEDGGIEIKCRSAAVHVGCMLGATNKDTLQIQGSLWICEREWWDYLCYSPTLPPVVTRYARDEKVIEAIRCSVAACHELFADGREQMESMGAKKKVTRSGNRCHKLRDDGRFCLKPAEIQDGADWYCEEHTK